MSRIVFYAQLTPNFHPLHVICKDDNLVIEEAVDSLMSEADEKFGGITNRPCGLWAVCDAAKMLFEEAKADFAQYHAYRTQKSLNGETRKM